MAHLLQEIQNYNESGRTTPISGSGFKLKEPSAPVIHEVVLGNGWIKPWFKSFYPDELVGKTCERLFVCQWCFKYTREIGNGYLRHMEYCAYREPRIFGAPIYMTPHYTIHELDGEEHKLFAQNLSLFAKLFLETKSVFYDVTTFLYYLLLYRDPLLPEAPPQIVAFFSKEKLSWDSNNLACILVFPPWQKRGLGQVLMGVSYELGRHDRRMGGPEKPLSELGWRAYFQYWSGVICRFVMEQPRGRALTVKEISEETFLQQEDVVATLKEMGVLEHRTSIATPGKKGKKATAGGGGGGLVINKAQIKSWMALHKIARKGPVDVENFDLRSLTPSVDEGESD